MDDAEQQVIDAIEAVTDPELKAALEVVWAKRCSPNEEFGRNSADWGITGTGVNDSASEQGHTLTIGIVQW